MEAKRQARMKNILENSEERIQRILRSKMEYDGEAESSEEPIVPISNLVEPGVNEGTMVEVPARQKNIDEAANEEEIEPVVDETSSEESTESEASEETVGNVNQDPETFPTPPVVANAKVDKRVKLRSLFYRFAILGIVIRILLCSGYGYVFSESLTLPFVLWMSAEMVLSSVQTGVLDMAETVPLTFIMGLDTWLSDGTKETLQFVYALYNVLLTYFSLYFFTFITTHVIVISLGY